MSVHMNEHHIDMANKCSALYFLDEIGHVFKVPKSVIVKLEQYKLKNENSIEKAKNKIKLNLSELPENVFQNINQKYTKAGALLKALRLRENISQKNFAAMLNITQGDLSKMERGRRPIGKTVAKRIAAVFNVRYELFLQ